MSSTVLCLAAAVGPRVAGQDAPFDFAAFKSTRIHVQSEPALLAALDRLHQDSPTFRGILAELATTQKNLCLLLRTTEEVTIGDLEVRPVPGGYILVVSVQAKIARLRRDSLEPWLGFLLAGLLEVSKSGNVVPETAYTYTFSLPVQKAMWETQKVLRRELKAANTKPRLILAVSGLGAYKNYLLNIQESQDDYDFITGQHRHH
jgi:hypothetical protein